MIVEGKSSDVNSESEESGHRREGEPVIVHELRTDDQNLLCCILHSHLHLVVNYSIEVVISTKVGVWDERPHTQLVHGAWVDCEWPAEWAVIFSQLPMIRPTSQQLKISPEQKGSENKIRCFTFQPNKGFKCCPACSAGQHFSC